MNLLARAKAMEAELIEIRRDLHRHPELSFQETRTAALAASVAEELGLEVRTGVGRTGVVADLVAGDGPTVALRADMDALPITESATHDYASTEPGVMHACGHDGHVAGLIGAMRLLTEARDGGELERGTVRFLFQPSEETADREGLSGAMRMVEDGAMDGVAAVTGLHIGGPLPSGKLFFGDGAMMAGAEEVRVEVHGVAGHAARPDLGVDAIALAAQGVLSAQQAVSRRLSPMEAGVLTFGTVRGGSARNAIADSVVLEGTLRFFSEETQARLHSVLEGAFKGLEPLGGAVEIHYGCCYPEVFNDSEVTEWVRSSAVELFGADAVCPMEPQTLSEDFSVLAREAPGTFFWVGAALPEPRLHHRPDFDIDESVLPICAAALAGGAVRILSELP